jgi:hypothetical protein
MVFLACAALVGLFACGVGLSLNWLPAWRFLSVCLRRWPFLDLVACSALSVCLAAVLAFP